VGMCVGVCVCLCLCLCLCVCGNKKDNLGLIKAKVFSKYSSHGRILGASRCCYL
jgi:hypothetical protein